MKANILIAAFFVAGLLISDICEARVFRRRRSVSRPVTRAPQEWYDSNDQGKCLIEAQYMFDNNIRGHVFGLIGRFEGCGWGGPNCSTCTPRYGMTLTGDAQVGRFRVRSWR